MTSLGPDTSDISAACRRHYLANLASLYRRDQDLAACVDALPFARAPVLEATRDGRATVRLTADDGRPVYAHSRYRPLDEAGKFVDNLPVAENPTFFISGLGVGYHLLELERRYDRPVLIVAEDDVGLIKAALCLHDFSALINDGRLIFLTSTDNNVLHKKLTACNADLMLGLQFVTLPHARRCHAQFQERIRRLLTDFVAFARTQMVTLLKTARITFKNVAFNLPSYLANPGIETLHERAAGYPAIIVAAGPSLARNLDQLGPLRERAVIIAVQTVFRLLHGLGLGPHFVTSLDFHEVSTEFFCGIDDVAESILVAEPKATWHVLDIFGGGKRVLHHRFYDVLLQQQAPPRGGLPPGTTVAHLAFYLAQHLGCDPIIFIGQDLAFSEGMFYMPGSPIEKIWQPELNRFQTLEMKQWERVVRNRRILRTVKDIHGRDTYADDLLFTYSEQFKNDFAAAPQHVIQATEGGVPLAGAEVMTLRDAAQRYCTRRLPPDLFAEMLAVSASGLKGRAAGALERRIEELEYVKKIAREMSGLLERLEALVERPAEFNRLIVRVDALRTLIHKYDEMYRLIIDVSAMAELRRYTADRRIGSPQTETRESARRRLERDRDFVESFIDGCEFLERVLPEALARLRERMT
ncbi:MAG: motility associated factor glycosyltransferase family protein [Phycisphaerae bacterium]